MTDEIVIRFSVADDGSPTIERVNKKLGETQKQSAGLISGLSRAKASVTDFISSNAALIAVLTGVAYAVRGVLQDHIEYGSGLKMISQISGATIEQTSRLVAVLGDYGITQDDITNSARAMKEQGLTPTLETLAALSDEYLAIQDPAQRFQFAQDNLGRSAAKYTEVLQKGSKAILEQGAAVDKAQIWTQEMADDVTRAKVAMDNWEDTIGALKTTLAVHLLPALNDSANGLLWLTKTAGLFFDAVKEGKVAEFDLGDALRQTREEIEGSEKAMLENADAAGVNSEAIDGLAESEQAAEEATKALSRAHEGLLSAIFAINSENENYQKTLDDLTASSADLEAEKKRLTLAMWEEQAAGKMTNDEYLRYVQQLDEITKAQEENAKAIEQAGEDHERAGKQRVYDLVQQRLAADGVIDSGEFEYLQNLAVQHGLVSKEAATQAIEESKLADQLISSFAATQPHMDAALSTMQQIAGYNGMVVNFGVNFSTSGDPQTRPGGYAFAHLRDSGGSGFAGTPYMIGTGAQPEVFIPNTNGTFVPNADKKLGGTYNIVINNPRKETAENSIRQSLKKLSYLGVAS